MPGGSDRDAAPPAGNNVAFLHTGDAGNLFELAQAVGAITAEASVSP
jgi:hypothetical protein